MKEAMRRVCIGVGALVLTSGWGATRYARDMVQGYAENAEAVAWTGGLSTQAGHTPPQSIALAGYAAMAVGALLLGVGLPRPGVPISRQ